MSTDVTISPEVASLTNQLPYSISGRWVHVITHLDPKYGGMSAAIPQLAWVLAKSQGYDVSIAAFLGDNESTSGNHAGQVAISTWPKSRKKWLPAARKPNEFRDMLRGADGVHIHGLWETSTAVGASSARRMRTPYIISAHGMLDRWALDHKRLKKRFYSALIERANMAGASCLHALTRAEAQDYRSCGVKKPIAVIPNGVAIPAFVKRSLFVETFPELEGRRIALFLGRIDFKKGLDILLEAWTRLQRRHQDTILVLAGPASQQVLVSVNNLLIELGVSDRVFHVGMLSGDLKWSALASAEVFILPSYSEGLSIATLEALAMGIPVIISEQCHMPEVADYNAGLIVQTDARSLTTAIDDILTNSPRTNAEIGENGKRLVHDRYQWQVVGRQMADLYRWVAGGGMPQSFEWIGARE